MALDGLDQNRLPRLRNLPSLPGKLGVLLDRARLDALFPGHRGYRSPGL